MPKPTEHKTVQARILAYAQEVGWTFVPRGEAEKRRGFRADAGNASLYFDDLLFAKVCEFNPKYREAKGALTRRLRQRPANIFGNRDFLDYLRNQATFFCAEENRELDLRLIDYEDIDANVFEVTEEFSFNNGAHGNREDVVFLVNGIPVLVIECKNATKDEAIALGVDQIRRYHDETPELFVPEMIFTATDAIGFSYGVTWNTVRRNIFNWKQEKAGRLEAKVKSFCDRRHVLDLLQHFIVFAEKDEELNKYILAQHQTEAVERVANRCLDTERTRGLVWHTQGSGQYRRLQRFFSSGFSPAVFTELIVSKLVRPGQPQVLVMDRTHWKLGNLNLTVFTMIKAAERLFKAPASEKPTILLMVDRNELEDQMCKNLAALGLNNVEHANRISTLVKLLQNDYRGIIVTTIHKFRDMPAKVNERSNVFVLIDEAHRTTGGDLGNFLMAGLPNATYIGFTGTPIDKTAYGKGTFKTFGCEDDMGYLHKYSIAESITDQTTLPLFYNLAPNEMQANAELMEEEFWALAEAEGVADVAELNKILERAVNLKNFLKGDERVDTIAQYVADHFKKNVEPLGYKAFLGRRRSARLR